MRYNRDVSRETTVLKRPSSFRWLIPAAFIALTLLAPDGALVCRFHRLVDPVVDPCDAPHQGAAGTPQHDAVAQKALPHGVALPAPVFRSAQLPLSAAPPNLGVVADVATPPPRC